MNSVDSCTAISESSSGPCGPAWSHSVVDQVGQHVPRRVVAGGAALRHEVDEVLVQLDVGGLARVADAGDVGIAVDECVHPRHEQLGVLHREAELQRRDLRGHRRRVVVAHVELVARGQRVEPLAREPCAPCPPSA